MKRNLLACLVVASSLAVLVGLTLGASDTAPQSSVSYEYITIRWSGPENTQVIRPGGEVEFVGKQLRNFKRPEHADDRSFYMNIVMNGLAREGWELTAMTPDDYVMKRLKSK